VARGARRFGVFGLFGVAKTKRFCFFLFVFARAGYRGGGISLFTSARKRFSFFCFPLQFSSFFFLLLYVFDRAESAVG